MNEISGKKTKKNNEKEKLELDCAFEWIFCFVLFQNSKFYTLSSSQTSRFSTYYTWLNKTKKRKIESRVFFFNSIRFFMVHHG